jgi:hypothetical protein
MANIYVRSTDGSDGDSGATWALAKATLAGASAIVAAGDTVWVSQVHSESTAGPITLDWNGTAAAPTRVLCGNDAAEPPTALATGAVIETTGNNELKVNNGFSWVYMYGLHFRSGVGTSLGAHLTIGFSAGTKRFERCTFELATTGSSALIYLAFTGAFGDTLCQDCDFKFANTGQNIWVNESFATIRGGAVLAGTTPTAVFDFASSGTLMVDGFDFSNCGSTMNICSATDMNALRARNCKLPASWTGSVNGSTVDQSGTFELYNSSSASTLYHYERKVGYGTITGEQTIVRSGGASDGTRSISWKMVSTADVEWNHIYLSSTKILRWIETVGSPVTATIEIVHDSVTNMTNQQIWLEVQYLGTSGSTLSSFIDDSSGDYLSSAADQSASSASWTTTGMTNPNTQQLSVTFTPQEAGFISAIVKVAMASKTVYVCPKMDVS